jgi:uncharacterized protein YjbJ (UPF0337 family)
VPDCSAFRGAPDQEKPLPTAETFGVLFHTNFENRRIQTMTWEQIGGNWKQFKGRIRERWAKLTDADLDMVNGQRERLVSHIQEKYGIANEVAEQQLQQFLATFKDMPQPGKTEAPQRGKQEEPRRTGSLG